MCGPEQCQHIDLLTASVTDVYVLIVIHVALISITQSPHSQETSCQSKRKVEKEEKGLKKE